MYVLHIKNVLIQAIYYIFVKNDEQTIIVFYIIMVYNHYRQKEMSHKMDRLQTPEAPVRTALFRYASVWGRFYVSGFICPLWLIIIIGVIKR